MYNFLEYNDMVPVDMQHCQEVKYTYFCHGNQTFTWLDHILAFARDIDNVNSCKIVPLDDGNLSDHLPMCMHIQVKYSGSSCSNLSMKTMNSSLSFLPPDWKNIERNNKYWQLLADKLNNVSSIDDVIISNREDAERMVETEGH